MSAEETVVEAAEEVAEVIVAAKAGKNVGVVAGVSLLAGVVIGGTVTYFVASKRLKSYYEEIARKEILEAKAWYAQNDPPETLEELAAKIEEKEPTLTDVANKLVEDAGYSPPVLEEDVKGGVVINRGTDSTNPPKTHNAFEEAIEEESILPERKKGVPYVITAEEFLTNEPEHEQTTITWYEGDGVLADAQDSVMRDVEDAIGPESLSFFGYGSKDPRVVHVRNVKYGTDFEVLKSDGKYSVEVLNFIEHDERRSRRQRKFRESDDE